MSGKGAGRRSGPSSTLSKGAENNEKGKVERKTAGELETPQEVLARMRAQMSAALERSSGPGEFDASTVPLSKSPNPEPAPAPPPRRSRPRSVSATGSKEDINLQSVSGDASEKFLHRPWFWQGVSDDVPIGVLRGQRNGETAADRSLGILEESLARVVELHEKCEEFCVVKGSVAWPGRGNGCHTHIFRVRVQKPLKGKLLKPLPQQSTKSRSKSPTTVQPVPAAVDEDLSERILKKGLPSSVSSSQIHAEILHLAPHPFSVSEERRMTREGGVAPVPSSSLPAFPSSANLCPEVEYGCLKAQPNDTFTYVAGLGHMTNPLPFFFVLHRADGSSAEHHFHLQNLHTKKFVAVRGGSRTLFSSTATSNDSLMTMSEGKLRIYMSWKKAFAPVEVRKRGEMLAVGQVATGLRKVGSTGANLSSGGDPSSSSSSSSSSNSSSSRLSDNEIGNMNGVSMDSSVFSPDLGGQTEGVQFTFEEVSVAELRQYVMKDMPFIRLTKDHGAVQRHPLRRIAPWDAPFVSWKRRLDESFADHEEFDVQARDAIRLAGLGYRMYRYIKKEKRAGRIPIMNPFYKSPSGPRMGVPVGGIGSGTIGRGWRGEFGRWQLYPGFPNYTTVDANVFSLFVTTPGELAKINELLSNKANSKAVVLAPFPPTNKALEQAWNWSMNGARSTYYALYPRSWTVYNEPDPNLRLTCQQMSPVIAHNYKESSYPLGVFEWTIENTDQKSSRQISLMLSFQNGFGEVVDMVGGHENKLFFSPVEEGATIVGLAMRNRGRRYRKADYAWNPSSNTFSSEKDVGEDEDRQDWDKICKEGKVTIEEEQIDEGMCKPDPISLGIAVQPDSEKDCDIFWCQKFVTNSQRSCEMLWRSFSKDGSIADDENSGPSKAGETIGGALAVRILLPPGGVRKIKFCLAWDTPIMRFSCGRAFYRRYTKWFGRDGDAIEKLLREGLLRSDEWNQQITQWQQPVLNNYELPLWYRHALFNELYYITEGGSVWTAGLVEDDDKPSDVVEKMDRDPEIRQHAVTAGLELSHVIKAAKQSKELQEMFNNGKPEGSEKQIEADEVRSRKMSASSRLVIACHICKQMVPVPVISQHKCKGVHSTPSSSGVVEQLRIRDPPTASGVDMSICEDRGGVIVDTIDDVHDMGRFGYMESLEYLMVNTYDVHFYASWALVMNWPWLEVALQKDFATFALVEYKYQWRTLHSGKHALRKVSGAVPHDLGTPGEDPWYLVNSYNIQPINNWKDLNSKFVLQIYRAYVVTRDRKFLWDCWDTVRTAMEYVAKFDYDMDGVIENEGFPDQTYDTWSAVGCSAYSGGLWLAALAAAASISHILGMTFVASKFEETLLKGRRSYFLKLWNQKGGYFNYDNSSNPRHDSIMADQMCGQWYSRSCGLPSIAEEENVRSALAAVYDNNVLTFKNGELGAVNGMRPSRQVDTGSLQSVEVWTGTTYGLAATMIGEGMVREGFDTAWGIVNTTYETKGYQFQTPEAWNSQGQYRALSYMRPLSIWGMQWAWERRNGKRKSQGSKE